MRMMKPLQSTGEQRIGRRGSVVWPKGKLFLLIGLVAGYIVLAVGLHMLVFTGSIDRLPPTPVRTTGNDSVPEPQGFVEMRLAAAKQIVDERLVRDNGHVDVYWFVHGISGSNSSYYAQRDNTNSEAISYRMLITAKDGDKAAFDEQVAFMQQHMLEPNYGYMMWRLEANDSAVGEGRNIAPDADLRAIRALVIAEEQWGDRQYTDLIDTLSSGLEELAITSDGLLAAYAGVSGPDSTWTTNEVYLSYTFFDVFEELSERRGEPWTTMNEQMKTAILNAQIHNGLYNSQLTEARTYGNGMDGGGYSINSLWIMVRSAESGDPELMESARTSLQFFKDKYFIDAAIYTLYDSSGNALSSGDAPWGYALVGRAAVALGDKEFADEMISKLLASQVTDEESPLYGAFPEGAGDELRVGQFTMQESILTLQDYLALEARSTG